ncbi:IclR family transcriptional regulator C-terminal domain-containing protein, partial [Acinetobacter baumannii]
HDYYERFQHELSESGFAVDEPSFIQRMRKIKKQGFYFSQGEIDPNVSGLAVPVRFSSKEVPLALTLVASKNRFDFLNIEKLIEILQENAALIEQRFMELSEKGEI